MVPFTSFFTGFWKYFLDFSTATRKTLPTLRLSLEYPINDEETCRSHSPPFIGGSSRFHGRDGFGIH